MEVYLNFNASKSGFCIMKEGTDFQLVKGGFAQAKEALDWVKEQGHVIYQGERRGQVSRCIHCQTSISLHPGYGWRDDLEVSREDGPYFCYTHPLFKTRHEPGVITDLGLKEI